MSGAARAVTMLHHLKVDKHPLHRVTIIGSQSVKNSSTATQQIGFDGGKLVKSRKRFLMVNTMGHLLWTGVRPANVGDGKIDMSLWEQAEHLNPLLDDLVLIYADSTFGGHFKEQLEGIYDMQMIIARTPINKQAVESKLVIHHWRWIVERTISWLGNNRRLSKDYERTILSTQTFIWIAHIRRTVKRVRH